MFNNIEPIIEKIKEYRCQILLIVGALFLCPLVVVHILFKLESGHDFITAEWSAGDLIGYIAGFGAFIGTVSLGIVTVLQNQKLYEETNKLEIRNLAIDKYALFTYGEIEARFYDDGDCFNNSPQAKLIKEGFNGNKAFWKYDSIRKDNLNIKIEIKNIGDYPAVKLMVADKNRDKIKKSNITHSRDGVNDSKYILKEESGYMIMNIKLKELYDKRLLKYYLKFENPFGSLYSQEITIESNHTNNKLIEIDAQTILEIEND